MRSLCAHHAVEYQPRRPGRQRALPADRAGLRPAETHITRVGPGPVRRWDSVEPLPFWSLNVDSVMQLSARNQIPARVTSISG